ncbi:Alginate biosynthesis sensor protein KinB [compost metagenome]
MEQREDELTIDYSDNGRGIPPEILPRIFDPFVTSKRGQGGSGLGTHIIYNLVVQLLRGRIHCASELGQGAHFHIRLPTQHH